MIPLSYNVRSILRRRFTAAATAGGLGLVVFVFAAVLMLLSGVRETLKSSGSPDNAILLRQGSSSETTSILTKEAAKVFSSEPTVAVEGGKPVASPELFTIFQLTRNDGQGTANTAFRGLTPDGWNLMRSREVKIIDGRVPQWATSEVLVGKALRGRFAGVELGQQIRVARRAWTVVGFFDAGGSSLESEVWADADQLGDASHRVAYSSMLVRLRSRSDLDALKAVAAADKRFTLEAKREDVFYEEAAGGLARFITALGSVISIFFTAGATLGAMITMYAQVASRIREVGTLRALGFRRSAVLFSFLIESTLLALIGAVIGAGCASLLSNVTFSTVNFTSFTEIKFHFRFTLDIALWAAGFALVMGLLGGLLPAIRAARLQIAEATKG